MPIGRRLEALAIGLTLTAAQVGLALLSSPGHEYSRLCGWDCAWYTEIARAGYHSPVPPVPQNKAVSNVAFFPAYPLLARALYLAFGVEPRVGLLLVAQAFCMVFWAALWLVLRRWRVPPAGAALVLAMTLAHPAAFFLVSGYSESLFLSMLLLFILHDGRRRASVSGFALSASRIVGLPSTVFPVASELSRSLVRWRPPRVRRLRRALGVAAAASLGALGFFAYCQLRFGRYDLYLETQKIGWGIVPDYRAPLKWSELRFTYPIDRWATGLSVGLFALTGLAEGATACFARRGRAGFARRLPVYLVASGIFYVTFCGLKSVGFVSMIRYSLPWLVLWLLCVAQWAAQLRPRARDALWLLGLLAASWALVKLQLPALRLYLQGYWFA